MKKFAAGVIMGVVSTVGVVIASEKYPRVEDIAEPIAESIGKVWARIFGLKIY